MLKNLLILLDASVPRNMNIYSNIKHTLSDRKNVHNALKSLSERVPPSQMSPSMMGSMPFPECVGCGEGLIGDIGTPVTTPALRENGLVGGDIGSWPGFRWHRRINFRKV
jgi:hypothetical protein